MDTIIIGGIVGIVITIIVIIYLLYSSGSSYTIEESTDYSGNHILSRPTSGISGCANLCRQTDGCKVGIYDNKNKECWLQSGLDNKETRVGYTSIYI